jgi:hypothetical protein
VIPPVLQNDSSKYEIICQFQDFGSSKDSGMITGAYRILEVQRIMGAYRILEVQRIPGSYMNPEAFRIP